MQRGANKEEKIKKEEEVVIKPDGNFIAPKRWYLFIYIHCVLS